MKTGETKTAPAKEPVKEHATERKGFWSFMDKLAHVIEPLDVGADAFLLYKLMRGGTGGGMSHAGGRQAPQQMETSNDFGLGDKDEARLLATYGAKFEKDEIEILNNIWKSLTPHQAKQLRIRLTALKFAQTEPSKNPDALTLKGLADMAKHLGVEEAKAHLLRQGVISLESTSEKAMNAAAKLLGLEPNRAYTFEELDIATAEKIRGLPGIPKPQPVSVGPLGWLIAFCMGERENVRTFKRK